MMGKLVIPAAFVLAVAAAACGGGESAAGAATSQKAAASAPATAEVEATGNVIEVKMVTDGAGNYFEPSEINAHPGDVVRFVLVSGVHNVSFPAARNEGLGPLPESSSYLQLPGQSWDLMVDFGPGEYFFQCDPHAALGMIGTLTVASE